MKTCPIVKEIIVNASPAVVWKAITHYEDMLVWYFDLPGFTPEVGYEFSFYGETADGTKYLHLCTIQEVVLHKKLSYTWRYDGYEGNSLVTFELESNGEQTLVRLTHSGFETFPADNKDLKKENFNGGWEAIIRESLKHFVETRN
jgi:uncharacterized protein YndB with AHSA1/START domain